MRSRQLSISVLEAIQNAAKHAGAGAQVRVTLARDQHAIEFTISDNGAGIQSDRSVNGMGITGMHDRIEAVGGQLEIRSAPHQGTMVHGTIPRPAEIPQRAGSR